MHDSIFIFYTNILLCQYHRIFDVLEDFEHLWLIKKQGFCRTNPRNRYVSKHRATISVSHLRREMLLRHNRAWPNRGGESFPDPGQGVGNREAVPLGARSLVATNCSWAECTTGARTPRCSNLAAVSTAEKRGRESRCCAASWTRVQFPGSSTPARSVTGSTGIFLEATRVVACVRSLNAARGLESAGSRHRVANDAWRPGISSNDAPPSTTWVSR